MRTLSIVFALGLALSAAPAHADDNGRNAGAFNGVQGYQYGGCTVASCGTYTSFAIVWGGADGGGRVSCYFSGGATYDGTTEQGTFDDGWCNDGMPAAMTYVKTGAQLSVHVEWSGLDVTWAATASGVSVQRGTLTAYWAGTASVYSL